MDGDTGTCPVELGMCWQPQPTYNNTPYVHTYIHLHMTLLLLSTADSLLGSGSEDEDDEEAGTKGHTSLCPGELPHAADLALNSDSKTGQDDSEDQVRIVA